MKVASQTSSFSAYGDARDIPRGAVSTKKPVQQNKPERKSRVGLLLILLLMSASVFFFQKQEQVLAYISKPVDKVLIANALNKVDELRLRRLLAQHMNVGFFVLDVKSIKSALEEDAWVERATVKRVWPDTLSVSIVEEVPIARWGEASLLSQYGQIFTPDTVESEFSLPLLEGPDGSQHRVMEHYQVFSQMISNSGLRIASLSLTDRGSWAMSLQNGIEITIGRDDVLERMQRLVNLYDRHLASKVDEIATLDLRYNNGVSVKRKAEFLTGIAAK
ncbi:MAG: cell division protein FtsQ/DivIB [Pseudohongiellaceae bacterium]|nr:cell division protein FtsQ/DivIB [Pseudohongiellaceae bacterium]